MQSYGNKTPYENRCYTADFTNLLGPGETIQAVNSVTVSVLSGIDPNPAAMLNGAGLVNSTGLIAGQWLQGGLPGVFYMVSFKVKTNIVESVEGQVQLPVVANL